MPDKYETCCKCKLRPVNITNPPCGAVIVKFPDGTFKKATCVQCVMGLDKDHHPPSRVTRKVICEICEKPFKTKRHNATTCGPVCKQIRIQLYGVNYRKAKKAAKRLAMRDNCAIL